MKMLSTVKRYLLRPEVGAGLLYVAIAAWVLVDWLVAFLHGSAPQTIGYGTKQAWMAVSFAVSVWLAFSLLRRRPGPRALKRLLLVAAVHAIGAMRFHELGLVLLSILPLFALLPAWLIPAKSSHDNN